MRTEPLPHALLPRPIAFPQARKCRECPAWVDFRPVDTPQGERMRPYCLEHDKDHFLCCPGAERIRREIRDRERAAQKRHDEARQRDWKKSHPDLEQFRGEKDAKAS